MIKLRLRLYAWEESFQSNVESIRDKEIKVLKKSAYLSAGTSFVWTTAPYIVSNSHVFSLE